MPILTRRGVSLKLKGKFYMACVVKEFKITIQCVDCSKWIHKRCSGYKGVLREGLQYNCPRYNVQIPNSVAPEETKHQLGRWQDRVCIEILILR